MNQLPHYDPLTLCPDYRFIRVDSENGFSYDLVRKWRAREHIFRLKQQHRDAYAVNRATVPPCIFRDFTDLDGPESSHDSVWKDGTTRFFSK